MSTYIKSVIAGITKASVVTQNGQLLQPGMTYPGEMSAKALMRQLNQTDGAMPPRAGHEPKEIK
jgi:hypothetical protein